MKQNSNTNAANRYSYVGNNYNLGEKEYKNKALEELPAFYKNAHLQGAIHIHDLDAYGQTYNCLTMDLVKIFPYKEFQGLNNQRSIIRFFDFLKHLFSSLGNEQSGGMAFANFDDDTATVFKKLNIKFNEENKTLFASCLADLILWCNETYTRMGQTTYYVSLNIGLARTEEGRFVVKILLDEFLKAGDIVFRPNIIFKVKGGINRFPEDPNYDLFIQSLNVTSRKMIPTYLLCDCKEDKEYDPYRLSIMGCRTRVVDDLFGEPGAIGRGNITNIAINLPHIALKIDRDYRNKTPKQKLDMFKAVLYERENLVLDILIDRFEKLIKHKSEDFPTNSKYDCWCESFIDNEDLFKIFRHGTLSIGFIGLSEAVEVLYGKKFYEDKEALVAAYDIVSEMKDFCDMSRYRCNLNISLLATAGELISGRFIEIDKQKFKPEVDIFSKGFYTNSFHVNVDSGLPAYKKLEIEGLFHSLCNGGSISYIELGEAPLGNAQGLEEYINMGVKYGVHYLGFNFPKDVCKNCGATGVFDECPICHSKDITRIRRVSGYLEVLDGFTSGKKAEEKARKANK